MPTIKNMEDTAFFHPTAAKKKPEYNPEGLLDAAIAKLGLKNDAALAKALDLYAPLISKIRRRRIAVSPYFLLRLIEATGWTVAEARQELGA